MAIACLAFAACKALESSRECLMLSQQAAFKLLNVCVLLLELCLAVFDLVYLYQQGLCHKASNTTGCSLSGYLSIVNMRTDCSLKTAIEETHAVAANMCIVIMEHSYQGDIHSQHLVSKPTRYCIRLTLPSSCFCAPAPACLAAFRSEIRALLSCAQSLSLRVSFSTAAFACTIGSLSEVALQQVALTSIMRKMGSQEPAMTANTQAFR